MGTATKAKANRKPAAKRPRRAKNAGPLPLPRARGNAADLLADIESGEFDRATAGVDLDRVEAAYKSRRCRRVLSDAV